MNIPPMVQVLERAGFTDGWALHGDILILWEHDEDPPTPLTRPETTHETIDE